MQDRNFVVFVFFAACASFTKNDFSMRIKTGLGFHLTLSFFLFLFLCLQCFHCFSFALDPGLIYSILGSLQQGI